MGIDGLLETRIWRRFGFIYPNKWKFLLLRFNVTVSNKFWIKMIFPPLILIQLPPSSPPSSKLWEYLSSSYSSSPLSSSTSS
mmetsp:Transcript_2903/g.4255  ORF Transcript_2903/g.4255 Transcript_2903/m.4255 type:complete len:82 (+) Transcript_2903:764-1009(+)